MLGKGPVCCCRIRGVDVRGWGGGLIRRQCAHEKGLQREVMRVCVVRARKAVEGGTCADGRGWGWRRTACGC